MLAPVLSLLTIRKVLYICEAVLTKMIANQNVDSSCHAHEQERQRRSITLNLDEVLNSTIVCHIGVRFSQTFCQKLLDNK